MSELESLGGSEPLARHVERHALDRLVMLSDGVFAIAITLAALEIRLPEQHGDFSAVLGGIIRPLSAYVLSFAIIALFWLRNRDLFARVARVDTAVTMLALAQLCLVALIPLGVRASAELDSEAGLRLYALVMLASGLANAVLWTYAALREGILRAGVARGYRRWRVAGAWLLVVVFALLPFVPLAISARASAVLVAVFALARRRAMARGGEAG